MRGHRNRFVLLTWLVVPYLVFTLARTKQPSFTAPVAPVFFIAMGLLARDLFWSGVAARQPAVRWARGAFLLLFLILVAGGARQSLKDAKRPPRGGVYQPAALAQAMRELPANTVVFGAREDYVQALFFAAVPVYPQLPNEEDLRIIERTGHRALVLVTEETGHPTVEASDPRVKVLRLPSP